MFSGEVHGRASIEMSKGMTELLFANNVTCSSSLPLMEYILFFWPSDEFEITSRLLSWNHSSTFVTKKSIHTSTRQVCNENLRQFAEFVYDTVIIKLIWNTNRCYPANIYLFSVNIRSTRKRCEICSKLTIKVSERRQWCRSDIFIVNFEHISHLFLVFLLLNLNK